MSSPLPKHGNDSSSATKPRKLKTPGLANKSSSNLDSRSELADLIKRKAEISVGGKIKMYTDVGVILPPILLGNIGQLGTTDLRI